MSDAQVKAELDMFRTKLEGRTKLKITRAERLFDRYAYYLEIALGSKQIDTILSEEFLSDLPATREYQLALDEYIGWLAGRMENYSPILFYCKAGIPLKIEIEWPISASSSPGVSGFVHVHVYDVRLPRQVAQCSVKLMRAASRELEKNPFHRERAIVNRIRAAVDRKELDFLPKDNHPSELQQLRIESNEQLAASSSANEVEQFISGKVYWLGFKQGDKRTRTWVTDPWDADYLQVELKTLTQSAQILAARRTIVLDSEGSFVSAGELLLLESGRWDTSHQQPHKNPPAHTSAQQSIPEWDAFISHASEDKEGFVRPLAEALQKRGLRVWYDEFTLRVGDGLRSSIDRGLACSRFGVVVLSPAFFSKHWTQRELDGLAAKEVKGKKVILPIWHNVAFDDVHSYSLMLADRVAASSADGIETVVQKLIEAMTN